MSEDSAERVEAAAVAAAAGVAAVEDQQAEQQRADDMQAATADASVSAEIAAEDAQEAAQAATAAAEAANQATQQAAQASDVASVAASEAYSARDDIGRLRQEVQQGWQDLRAHLDEKFGGNQPSEQPTEVVVTNERTDNSSERRSDTGGTSDTPGPGDNQPKRARHKFGSRR